VFTLDNGGVWVFIATCQWNADSFGGTSPEREIGRKDWVRQPKPNSPSMVRDPCNYAALTTSLCPNNRVQLPGL